METKSGPSQTREQKEAREDCQLALNDLDAKWLHLYLPLRLEHWGTGWLISSGAYSSQPQVFYFPSKIRQLLDFVLTVVLTITLSINIPLQTSIMLRNASICHTWEFISRAAVATVVLLFKYRVNGVQLVHTSANKAKAERARPE